MKYQCFVLAIFTLLSAGKLSAGELSGLAPELVLDNHDICTPVLAEVTKAHYRKKRSYFDRKTGFQGLLNPVDPEHYPEKVSGKKVHFHQHRVPGCAGLCEASRLLVSNTEIPAYGNRDERKAYLRLLKQSPPAAEEGTLLVRATDGSYFGLSETPGHLFLYQLQPGTGWLESCKIRLRPGSLSDIPAAPASVIGAIEELRFSRHALAGGGGQCGSMDSADRWRARFERDLPVLLSRPWLLMASIKAGRESYAVDLQGLRDWSLMDIGNRQKFQSYRETFSIAIERLSSFYRSTYGWERLRAEKTATAALEALVGESIRFFDYHPFAAKGERKLRQVILDGGDISAIKFDYDEYREALNEAWNTSENLLTIAVDNPSALQFLLGRKLSVDRQNPFGKTALMYAAQHDNVKAVKALLSAGADVNAETYIPSDRCNYTIRTSGYTPLHYAARYASREVVELLLNAGASPYAETGGKYGENKDKYPHDWLAGNDKLSAEDKIQLRTALSVPSQEDAKLLSGKFNREAERAYGEGDKSSAYEALRTAIQLDGTNYRALANMSLVALRVGDQKRALRAGLDLKNTDASDKLKAAAYFNIALTLEDFFVQNPHKRSFYVDSDRYYKMDVMDSLLMAYKLAPSEARADKLRAHLDKVANVSCPEAGDSRLYVTTKYDWSRIGEQGKRAQRIAFLRRGPADVEKICWNSDFASGSKRICTSEVRAYDLGDYSLNIFAANGYQLGDTPSYSITIDDISCGSL